MQARTIAVAGTIVAAVVLAPRLVLAAHLRPGMWKVTTKIDMGASAPQIPPEQLARLQSLGIKIPAPDQGFTTQQCVTPEMAARDVPPHMGSNDSGCTSKNEKISESEIRAELVCSGSMKGQGAMQLTSTDQDHYTGSFNFKGTTAGHAVDLKSTFTGERISATCK